MRKVIRVNGIIYYAGINCTSEGLLLVFIVKEAKALRLRLAWLMYDVVLGPDSFIIYFTQLNLIQFQLCRLFSNSSFTEVRK